MSNAKMPPLPSGSVDGNALEKALASKNVDPAKAIAEATTRVTPAKVSEVVQPTDDFVMRNKGGGWLEITGPGLSEPFRTQDEAKARRKFASLTGTDADTITIPQADA